MITSRPFNRPPQGAVEQVPFGIGAIHNLSTAVTAFIATTYGEAISTMARKDLGVTTMRFMAEILSLAKDAAELAIELG